MEKTPKIRVLSPSSVVLFVISFNILVGNSQGSSFSESCLLGDKKKNSVHPVDANRLSSVVFQVYGDVYPKGYYHVKVGIGRPPKLYDFDIDTGSDFTWVQCDAPCVSCTVPRDQQYKPQNNLVPCREPLCRAIPRLTPNKYVCKRPNDQCDYEIGYLDGGSSLGAMVADHFPLLLMNGSRPAPRLAFGCGYDQKFRGSLPPPPTSGIIGLGSGKVSFISQLRSLGVTRSVIGQCLGQQGGFLFFGDDLVPSSRVMWTPMSRGNLGQYYTAGPAELLFNGKSTNIKGLELIFDSGSSFTYFNAQVYKHLVNVMNKNLNSKAIQNAPDEKALPICWKTGKSLKSVNDVSNYFPPLIFRFTKLKNVQLVLAPENYLIVTERGNVCLGILNGTQQGLKDMNVIGDISMTDKMVIFDNEKQQIGWTPSNCNKLPNVGRDYDEDICPPYAATFSILDNYYSTSYAAADSNLRFRLSDKKTCTK